MMRRLAALAAAVVMAASPAVAAPAPDAFLKGLYARYADENFNLFEKPEQWFAPDLLAAMKENEDLTPDDEIGAVDHDPVCQCQDFSGMMSRVAGAQIDSPTTATGLVDLWWGTDDQRRIVVELVLVNEEWRIRDIRGADGESFLAYVRKANQDAKNAR